MLQNQRIKGMEPYILPIMIICTLFEMKQLENHLPKEQVKEKFNTSLLEHEEEKKIIIFITLFTSNKDKFSMI